MAKSKHPQSWLCLGLLAGLGLCTASAGAQTLTGTVSSTAGKPMAGVMVSAQLSGSDMSFSVASQPDGGYAFSASALPPGAYQMQARAVGYLLSVPTIAVLTAGKPAQANLTLTPTNDLAGQLTSAEWLQSVPGTPEQKEELYHCAACHSLTPVVESQYSAQQWLATLVRMRHYGGESVRTSPIVLPFPMNIKPDPELAAYLASINQGPDSKWNYKTAKLTHFARPTGAATHVLITEYSLPAGRLPHDAIVGPGGYIWYNDFQQDLIGRLDPKTGATKEWQLPPLKPGFPAGQLALKFGPDGDLWIPRFRKGGLTRFDPRTQKFTTWVEPAPYNNAHADTSHVSPCGPNGTVWWPDTENRVMFRLTPSTGKIETFQLFPNYHPTATVDVYGHSLTPTGHRSYGTSCDSKGNIYYADIAGGYIGRISARTGQATLYKTPTLDSGPRRMAMDSHDILWFGENFSSKLGMFNTVTHQFKEFTPSTPWSGDYPAMRDKNGDVWTGGMSTDYVYRLNPSTGVFTEYLLPTLNANIRRIYTQDSTTPPTVWVCEVHRGKIASIQALPN